MGTLSMFCFEPMFGGSRRGAWVRVALATPKEGVDAKDRGGEKSHNNHCWHQAAS